MIHIQLFIMPSYAIKYDVVLHVSAVIQVVIGYYTKKYLEELL